MTDAGAPLYVGSDGDTYGAGEVARKLADGEWRFCARDRESRTELFEVGPGELIALVPADNADVDGRRRRSERR